MSEETAQGILLYGALVIVLACILSGLIHHWIDQRKLAKRRVRAGSAGPRLRARMKRLARPTLLLTPAKAPGFSKIGGAPELPKGLAWPLGEREPRAFVGQVDLAAFRSHVAMEWLPEEGRIWAFFDDERNGATDCVQILHSLQPFGPEAQPPQPIQKKWRFAERRVEFLPFDSVPSTDWLEADDEAFDPEELGANLNFFGDEIEHRIGGYPSEIQGGQMAVECEYMRRGLRRDWSEPVPDAIQRASRQWRMLLQVDSDPALGMNWWDTGRLYVFVRANDAKRGDFSKTVTITQSH